MSLTDFRLPDDRGSSYADVILLWLSTNNAQFYKNNFGFGNAKMGNLNAKMRQKND